MNSVWEIKECGCWIINLAQNIIVPCKIHLPDIMKFYDAKDKQIKELRDIIESPPQWDESPSEVRKDVQEMMEANIGNPSEIAETPKKTGRSVYDDHFYCRQCGYVRKEDVPFTDKGYVCKKCNKRVRVSALKRN